MQFTCIHTYAYSREFDAQGVGAAEEAFWKKIWKPSRQAESLDAVRNPGTCGFLQVRSGEGSHTYLICHLFKLGLGLERSCSRISAGRDVVWSPPLSIPVLDPFSSSVPSSHRTRRKHARKCTVIGDVRQSAWLPS